MLAEHGIQHAALWRQKLIVGDFAGVPLAIGDLKDIAEQVRKRLVRTEDAEVPLVLVEARHVAQEFAEHQRVLCADRSRRGDHDRVVAKVRHLQIAQKNSAVRMRVGAHPTPTLRRERGKFSFQRSVRVEEFFRPVALHPAFQELDVVGVACVDEQRNLMRPERSFDLQAVDDLRPAPALGRSEDDHGPARPCGILVVARAHPNGTDLADGVLDRRRHQPVHLLRLFAFNEEGRPPAAAEELFQLVVLDAGEDSRIADLEAVQVQDRQDRPVRDRIEKFVGLPGGGQGAGFRFAVADDACDDQPRIVERGAEGMAQRITEFAALVNGSRRRRRHMARNAAGKRELLEKPFHTGFVLADVGINLAVAPLKIGVGDQGRTAMAGAGDVDHIEIVLSDRPVQMHVNEILPWRRSPVPDHQRFDMRQRERLTQEWIRVEVDLTDREVVCGAPVGVELPPFVGLQDVDSLWVCIFRDGYVSR